MTSISTAPPRGRLERAGPHCARCSWLMELGRIWSAIACQRWRALLQTQRATSPLQHSHRIRTKKRYGGMDS
eukprot:9469759-Pyramimonas_sp.AAC.1